MANSRTVIAVSIWCVFVLMPQSYGQPAKHQTTAIKPASAPAKAPTTPIKRQAPPAKSPTTQVKRQAIPVKPKRPAAAIANFNRGVALLQAKQYEEAATAFSAAMLADATAVGPRINLGVALWSLQDYENGLVQLDAAVKLAPDNGYAYSQRALCKLGLKDYPGALADFDRGVELSPRAATVLSNRGVAKLETGDFLGAKEDFTAALKLTPGDKDLLHNIKVLDFATINKESEEQRRARVERSLTNMGVLDLGGKTAANIGRPGGGPERQFPAQTELTSEQIPADELAEWHYNKACRYLSTNKYSETVKELDLAIQNREDPEYFLCRSSAYSALGEPQLALADCNRALELNAKDANAYLTRCRVYLDLREAEAALRDGALAAQLDKEASEDNKIIRPQDIYLNLGRAHYMLRNFLNAVEDFNRAIELDQQFPLAFHSRAIAHMESSNTEQAISDFKQAYELYNQQGNASAAAQCQKEIERLSRRKARLRPTRI